MLAALVTWACMMQQVSVAPNEVLQQCKTMTVLEKDGRQGQNQCLPSQALQGSSPRPVASSVSLEAVQQLSC